MTNSKSADVVVIGGGVVGASIGYGLVKSGCSVILLDEGDVAFRAARGNFGLVWVQGKGLDNPAYAKWTMRAASAWRDFAEQLSTETGLDLGLQQRGGLTMHLDDRELSLSAQKFSSLNSQLDGLYPYQILDGQAVRELVPCAGPDVVGAVFCQNDGHVNPLKLLCALSIAFKSRGGIYEAGRIVSSIESISNSYRITTKDGSQYLSARVVLAAGLGNRVLAPLVGLNAPVEPNRGQILVTEKLKQFLPLPTLYVRQTDEGVIQIGDSKENVGFNDSVTVSELARIANRAIRCFPLLSQVKVVRTWGALRVMSPDGYPIYQQSLSYPGAFVVTCHSGVTLAPMHSSLVSDWIAGAEEPSDINSFKAERFNA